uniref:Uncharacterized protein n=1 Tax=Electrophorus electricus TaxID=8005 RepID=A0A4W4DU63_ELEEL
MKMQYTQHIDQTTETYPEVVGIHVEFFRVDSAQRSVGTLDVVQVLHAFVQSTHDDFTVRRHFGVPHNGRGAGYVTKGSEVSLCPWVYNQKPETRESIILKEELGVTRKCYKCTFSRNLLPNTENGCNLFTFNVSSLRRERRLIG